MSPRKLVLALALLAFAGGVWADNTEPKRDSKATPAASQEPKETKAAQPSSTAEPAAAPAPAETRDTAPAAPSASRSPRHPGATQADIDWANKYYPGG